jgi:hypothetical protein
MPNVTDQVQQRHSLEYFLGMRSHAQLMLRCHEPETALSSALMLLAIPAENSPESVGSLKAISLTVPWMPEAAKAGPLQSQQHKIHISNRGLLQEQMKAQHHERTGLC